MLTQICISMNTVAYPVFVVAELSDGSFFEHKIKNNSSPLIVSLSFSPHLRLQITLNSAKIKLPNLPQGSSSSAGSRQKIYELCVCPNGRLFLSQAGTSSTCQINTSVCLWETICSGGIAGSTKASSGLTDCSCQLFLLEHRKPIKDFFCVRARVCEYIYIKIYI